jgi:hypothetical protein
MVRVTDRTRIRSTTISHHIMLLCEIIFIFGTYISNVTQLCVDIMHTHNVHSTLSSVSVASFDKMTVRECEDLYV